MASSSNQIQCSPNQAQMCDYVDIQSSSVVSYFCFMILIASDKQGFTDTVLEGCYEYGSKKISLATDDIGIQGFKCPCVLFLHVVYILIDTYLLINLGASTWTRFSVWLVAGALLYVFYGRKHNLLSGAVLVPTTDYIDISAAHPRTD